MARYFGAMRQVIERHGGTVEKFIGDAVMAVFGVPVLHEDDALRAVRAVCEMREALVLLNEELERDYGTRLALRIGVNTGEVVTGTEERLATGDAVNVAARLEQAAPPGEILVGAETLALVRDAVEVEPLAPLELKGKSEPLARSVCWGCVGALLRSAAASMRRWLGAAVSCGGWPTVSSKQGRIAPANCLPSWARRVWVSRVWRRSSGQRPMRPWCKAGGSTTGMGSPIGRWSRF